jgi:hypothetical protein
MKCSREYLGAEQRPGMKKLKTAVLVGQYHSKYTEASMLISQEFIRISSYIPASTT